MMKKILSQVITLIALVLCCFNADVKAQEPADYVNPFVGTAGHGHTYPGAAYPFGMVQLSSDTRLTGWDGCSAYHYSDSVTYGFSHTHLSGTGVSDYGDVLLMPYNERIDFSGIPQNGKWVSSSFSHEKEKASPGYYEVFLEKNDINVQLTVSPRCGFHRYKYSETNAPKIFLDLKHRDKVIDSKIQIIDETKIAGYRISGQWAKEQHVYFAVEFSEPIVEHFILENDSVKNTGNAAKGKNLKASFLFANGTKEILVKVGISPVSMKNARLNLEKEIPGWNFESIYKASRNAWNRELSKIDVKGGTKSQMRTFYTALYHSFLNPNLYMDVNGEYRGRDLAVHQADDFTNYTVFSLWDTYRATHPLFTILQQKRTNDFINTFIKQYEQGGELPVWELAANETDCMIGYHAVSVIADAWLKGINGFDAEKAFEAMKSSAEQDEWGLKYYKKYGYIPADKESESVSKTLEYAYDDWCIAQMAKKMGYNEDFKRYIQRAQYYKNIFDHKTGFMRAKMNNQWQKPFDPKEVNFHFTEANSWQYSFYVPQDIKGLIKLHGGKAPFEKKLDQLFRESTQTTGRSQVDITGLIGQYAHGNEPSHHMAYLYNYIGKPWKTQKLVRKIMDDLYSDQPDGLCGNEDCGQMSSWYVFSALGFYPVTPGSNEYVIGTPVFEEARIHLENGEYFTVRAKNISDENIYIQSAELNGSPFRKSFIKHETIMQGGELIFIMGPEPNKNQGFNNIQTLNSSIKKHPIVAVPYVEEAERTFKNEMDLRLAHADEKMNIFYRFGNQEDFKKYTKPLILESTRKVHFYAVNNEGKKSPVLQSKFFRVPDDKNIEIKPEPNPQYTAGGEEALIDGIRGGKDFRLGDWQGYQYDDFEAVITLDEKQHVNKVAAGFLQDQNSWIFMPVEVSFFISDNGKNFEKIATLENTVPQDYPDPIIKDFSAEINQKTKYIKVKAKNLKYCPEWHKGYPYGGKAFIFIDEIIVK
jgi:predicted alpha-1,2-mannosidase